MYHQIVMMLLVGVYFCIYSLIGQNMAQTDINDFGPFLISTSSGPTRTITLYDIGTGRIMRWERNYDPFQAESWSPDGCQLLIRTASVDEQRWAILNVENSNMQSISVSSVSPPIWSLDSQTLIFSLYNDSINSSLFYNLDINSGVQTLLFTVDGGARPDTWLSNSQLLYVTDGDWFIWDAVTQSHEPFPSNGQLSTLDELLYFEALSPDRLAIARFFDLREYQDMSDGEETNVDTIGGVDSRSGFEIIYLGECVVDIVEMEEGFLQSLEWSASGNQILISTYPNTTPNDINGVYIYNLNTENVRRVGDFPALSFDTYSPYIPTFSADEQWVSLRVEQNHIIYNLETGQIIELAGVFDSRYLRLSWSPIMSYGEGQCD